MIGENSAGKTSFLAGCRLLLEMMRGSAVASFNKDPFYLGAFDQIAHYRGGKGGRAQTFVLSVSARVRPNIFRARSTPQTPERKNCTLSIGFYNKYSQPSIKYIAFSTENTSFQLNNDNSIEIQKDNQQYSITGDKISEYENLSFPHETALFNIAIVRRLIMTSRHILSSRSKSLRSKNPELYDELRSLEEYVSGFRQHFARRIFASAPVRTRPDRIYSPTEFSPSPEGNHMPNALARLKRFSPSEWVELKDKLDKFGLESGLYNSIDLKSLGKSGSDPFQLMIGNGGPQRNLMDVGYGVSQSIPIVSEILTNKQPTFFLLQQPEVHLHPKAQAALGTFFSENATLNKNSVTLIETHSDYLVDRIRSEIKNSNLDHRLAQILYFSRSRLDSHIHVIKFSRNGSLINVPEGYREFFLEEAKRTFS